MTSCRLYTPQGERKPTGDLETDYEHKALFDAVRIVKGAGLTQADVDLINRALMRDVAGAATGMRTSAAEIDLIHSSETLQLTA